MACCRRQRVSIEVIIAHKRAGIEAGSTCGSVGESSRDVTGELIIRHIEHFQALEEAKLGRDRAREEVKVEVKDIKVSTS